MDSGETIAPGLRGRVANPSALAEKIAAYEERRITEVSAWTVRNDLTVLRHLRTAVKSLAGLTPDAATLDRMTHKQSHSVESGTEQKVQTP